MIILNCTLPGWNGWGYTGIKKGQHFLQNPSRNNKQQTSHAPKMELEFGGPKFRMVRRNSPWPRILGWRKASTCTPRAPYNPDVGYRFPGGSEVKESALNVGDLGSISRSGRCPGEGNGYPLQYFCLENSMDRGAWQATVHGVTKSQTWLSD